MMSAWSSSYAWRNSMKRTLEPVPELRAPEPWEHLLVEQTLIVLYREKKKSLIRWPGVIGCLVGVMLVGDVGSGSATVGTFLALLLLILGCFYLNYTSIRRSQRMKSLVAQMERREYGVALGWAVGIRCVTGEGKKESYGLAKVRLDNGRMLEKEYVLPYDYASSIVKRRIHEDQRVLLVQVPQQEKYRLVPIPHG